MATLFEAAGGEEGLLALAHVWHARVMADDVVSHAFSHGFHPDHTQRLAAYWIEALGGPPRYSTGLDARRSGSTGSGSTGSGSTGLGDESSVVRMHSGNGSHEEMGRRAIACFDLALVDAGLAGDDRLRRALHDYFCWATTTTMSRFPGSADDVPDGMIIPKWSWHGLITD